MDTSAAEYYTKQFYTWEYRGRGWYLCEAPVHLEAPFIPFIRHSPQTPYIDDGRRPTLISRFLESFSRKRVPTAIDQPALDYDTLLPIAYERDEPLVALRVTLTRERVITPERMKMLLQMLAVTHTNVSFEIIGTAKDICIQFVSTADRVDEIQAQCNAFFPEFTLREDNTFIEEILQHSLPTHTIDFGLKDEFFRPINSNSKFSVDPLTAIIGILEQLKDDEQAGMQILFTSTANDWSASIQRATTFSDGSSFFADAPESPKLAHEKIQSPLFGVTIRVFAQAGDYETCGVLSERLSQVVVKTMKSPWNSVIPLTGPSYDFETRAMDILFRESHRLGMLLNADELVQLVHFPTEQIQSKKLFPSTRKTKAVPAIATEAGITLGVNIHNGNHTDVSISDTRRLQHTHIIGATGTGKSTMLLSMIVQDMKRGNGLAVIDPHGDLIDTILAHVPEDRRDDVIIVDPSDGEYPVGLNILQAHSEAEKEVLSSDLVAVFRRNSTTWGDQMNSVLGNAILAFLESNTKGTLGDLRRFLIEKEYRQIFLKTVSDPHIRYYWEKEYPLLKTNSIGPILTRLDTFLRPKLIRNMVCQKKSLHFDDILNSQKILLIKLSQGLIGEENSYLLGSFIVSKLHQAALARQSQTIRKPFFLYVDEFHHFITPSMVQMLSGVRKYHVGLTLAHQDMQQLKDGDIASSVIANAGTRICFRVGEADAKRLEEGFASFEAKDLLNLGRGEAIARVERSDYDFSLDTVPLEQGQNTQEIRDDCISQSRMKYGTPKADIEKLLSEGLGKPHIKDTPIAETVLSEVKEAVQSSAVQKAVQLQNIPLPKPERAIPTKQVQKEETQHRYLQNLIKKMAEAKGYKATLEAITPDGLGKVDVLLEKDGFKIACEISVTTDTHWETRNVRKCLIADYDLIICCLPDTKAATSRKKKMANIFSDVQMQKIKVCDPAELINYLGIFQKSTHDPLQLQIQKGFRVTVNYKSNQLLESDHKRKSVAKIIAESIRNQNRKLM